jgi:hypothetical protein
MDRKGKHFPLELLDTVHHLNFTTLQRLKKLVRFSSSDGTGKRDPNFLGPTEIVCFYCRYDGLKRMDMSKPIAKPIVTCHSHQPCIET